MNAAQQETLFTVLKTRFEKCMHRHQGMEWADVQARLDAAPQKLRALDAMESSGGEPDVVGQDGTTGEYVFVDCATESPTGRRSVCYDREGLESRKEQRPLAVTINTAVDMATAMGIEMLTEEEYRQLQQLGSVDLKTSSWVKTPPAIRKLGGALFCDRRYDCVFTYHNGAQSYYGGRAFRGSLRV